MSNLSFLFERSRVRFASSCQTPALSSRRCGGMGVQVPAEAVAGTDLADSRGLDDAASFVIDLLERPASEIRVAEGQLDLEHDVVVEGHPDAFDLTPLS